jgi:hypothetical protein
MERKYYYNKHTWSSRAKPKPYEFLKTVLQFTISGFFWGGGDPTVIEKDTNRYKEQHINKAKRTEPLKPKTVHCQWKEVNV